MVIRLAREADLVLLPGIELSAAMSFQGLDVPSELLLEATPAMNWRPHLAAGLLWVAEGQAGAVGFLAGRESAHGLHVDEVDVAQGHQRAGLGRRLIQTAVAEATERGCHAVTLTTFRLPPWNAPFYARLGFRVWEDPPEPLLAILNAEAQRGLNDRVAMRLDL